MSEIFAVQLTAVATLALAALALATAVLAYLAWRKQSREVSDQAGMLRVQGEQLELQRKTSANQAEVLELQAKELRESLEERQREADERRRGQASKVTAWFSLAKPGGGRWGAWIRNGSDLPVLDVRTFFHNVQETQPGSRWEPVMRGSLSDEIRVLPPQVDRFFDIPLEFKRHSIECDDSVFVVSIEFTDASGNRWERDPRGALNPRNPTARTLDGGCLTSGDAA
jgi:hypothetical protein